MFEESLKYIIKEILDIDKVVYDKPGDSQEQECVFIIIDNSRNKITDKKQRAKVTGTIRVFAELEKLPYGYFSKKIAEAPNNLTRNLFFYDFEDNVGTFGNIVERSASFVYLFNSQFDPSLGNIERVTIEEI